MRLLIPGLIILMGGFQSCLKSGSGKHRIVYVNSYHRGFPPSDRITDAVKTAFPADSFELHSFFMDTKRHPSKATFRRDPGNYWIQSKK